MDPRRANKDFERAGVAAMLASLALGTVGCAHKNWQEPSDGWKRVASEHFLVHTDGDAADYAPVIERLEDVHTVLESTFFKGVKVSRAEVMLFASERDFKAVAPKETSGYFVGGFGTLQEGLMVFSSAGDFDVVAGVAAHELAHKFLAALSPRVPAWLHEGFAKYVGGISVDDDMVMFDMGDIHGGYVYFADPVPLAQLFLASSGDFHAGGQLAHYMTAWILMRQLLGAPGGTATERFRTLVDEVAAAATPAAQETAVRSAFGGAPLAEIQTRVTGFHSAVYHGIGQEEVRRTVGATLRRPARPPLQVAVADRDAVRSMCIDLRRISGR